MIVLLDTGVLGKLAQPQPDREAHGWLVGLLHRGRTLFVPEVADYELRREFLRARLIESIRALDELPQAGCQYLPVTTAAFRAAAEYWAMLRQQALPTAGNRELDADCILAGQARDLADQQSREVVVATNNLGHLGRMTRALNWRDIS